MYNCRPAHPDVGPHAGRVGDTQGQGRHKQAGSILYSLEICYVKRSRVQPDISVTVTLKGDSGKKNLFAFTNYKLHYKLQIANYILQITNYKLQITNCKLQITNYKLQITNYKLQILQLQTKYCSSFLKFWGICIAG